VPQVDHACVVKLAIGLGDGVGVDDQLLRERADTGQLLARAHGAGFDAVLHLLHQLQVDRHAGGGVGWVLT
jgi:hypothetical protein